MSKKTNKIKVENDEWIFFSMLYKYATTCFEILKDPHGASCIILNRKVIGFTKIYCDEFYSHMRLAFIIRGSYDIDIQMNMITYTRIRTYKYLNSIDLFGVLCELKDFTGENYLDNIWRC